MEEGKDKNAIELASKAELKTTLKSIKTAVTKGEFDTQLEVVTRPHYLYQI